MDQDAPVAIVQSFDEESDRIKPPIFVPKAPRCPKREADEILVCAQDPETFRLKPLPEQVPDEGLPRSRMGVGENASIGVEVERAGVGSEISNRVMIRGRLKF